MRYRAGSIAQRPGFWEGLQLTTVKRRLTKLVLTRWALLRHPMTVGARALVIEDGKVLLVRHGYAPGWHFPGGGVETGETAAEACVRELREEAGLRALGAPELLGLYFNPAFGGRDHVALFRVDAFERGPEPTFGREIAGRGWFPLDALPDEASSATRRRLAEIAGKRAGDGMW